MRARFFGHYLVSSGKISAKQLADAVEYQNRNNTKLGTEAVALGLVTPYEVEQILALQAKEDLQFGAAAIALGLLDATALERVRSVQHDHHLQLGDALVALGYLGRDEVEAAAARFQTTEAELEPEVVTVPKELPLHDVAFDLFYLANKLLLRVCDLPSKTERLCVTRGELLASDYNACVSLNGARTSRVYLCVPRAIALMVASRYSGELEPSELQLEQIVLGLANLLGENLSSALREHGLEVATDPAQAVTRDAVPGPDAQLAWVPFLTHRGDVHVGLTVG